MPKMQAIFDLLLSHVQAVQEQQSCGDDAEYLAVDWKCQICFFNRYLMARWDSRLGNH